MRTTVPPGAQHARRSCASRARGRSSASRRRSVIRSKVRPRSSQVLEGASSTGTPCARERGHPRVELDAEHGEPARRQRAARPCRCRSPTSSTPRRRQRDEIVDERGAERRATAGRSPRRSSRRTRPARDRVLVTQGSRMISAARAQSSGGGTSASRRYARRAEERARRDDHARLEPPRGERVGVRPVHPEEERRVAARAAQAQRLQRGQQRRRAWRGSARAPRDVRPRRPRPRSPRAGRTRAAPRRRSAGTSSARRRSPGRRRRTRTGSPASRTAWTAC